MSFLFKFSNFSLAGVFSSSDEFLEFGFDRMSPRLLCRFEMIQRRADLLRSAFGTGF
jgi:hypothetical protein